VEANGIPHAPLEARRSLRVGLVRDIFDTVTRSKECFLNDFQLPASHIEPLFNTRHLEPRFLRTFLADSTVSCSCDADEEAHDPWLVPRVVGPPACDKGAPDGGGPAVATRTGGYEHPASQSRNTLWKRATWLLGKRRLSLVKWYDRRQCSEAEVS